MLMELGCLRAACLQRVCNSPFAHHHSAHLKSRLISQFHCTKMADGDDGLSDVELRAQLKQHGINHGPITASTRGILLKKLRTVKEGNSPAKSASKQAKKRRSVATSTPTRQKLKVGLSGFSSEEDDFSGNGIRSVDFTSPDARRRSAFPKLSVVNNKDKEERSASLNRELEEEALPAPPLTRRRSLPRNALKETKSLDRMNVDNKATTRITSFVHDEQVHQIRNNVRKNSFEFEESDGTAVAVTKDKGTSPGINYGVSRTLEDSTPDLSTRRKFAPRVAPSEDTEASPQSTINGNDSQIRKTFPAEASEDDNQDDEELEVGFGQSGNLWKSLKGPCFVLLVALMLMLLAGSYISLFHARSSELPELTGNSTI